MFKNCIECPFLQARKNNQIARLYCDSNGKYIGLIDKKSLASDKGVITPPWWCPHNA